MLYVIHEMNQLAAFKEGWERFNISLRLYQKTSWVEEHCPEILHSNKIEINILQ